MAEYNIQKKEKDLENVKKVIAEFKERISIEVRRQEKLNIVKEQNFKKKELLEKYITKILCKWDNGKFKKKYCPKIFNLSTKLFNTIKHIVLLPSFLCELVFYVMGHSNTNNFYSLFFYFSDFTFLFFYFLLKDDEKGMACDKEVT